MQPLLMPSELNTENYSNLYEFDFEELKIIEKII